MAPPRQPQSGAPISDILSQAERLSPSPRIAEDAIALDLEEDDSPSEDESDLEIEGTIDRQFSMINSYRRPSYVNPGSRGTAIFSSSVPSQSHTPEFKKHSYLSKRERQRVLDDERNLLRDNHLLSSKHRRGSEGGGITSKIPFPALGKSRSASAAGDGHARQPTEQDPLLGDSDSQDGSLDTPRSHAKKFNQAVASGQLNASWQLETKVLMKSSAPLILTFLLQYSLPVASIFAVGHIGKIELGAVSLASSEYQQNLGPKPTMC